jgi:DDE superfamily endonuclease
MGISKWLRQAMTMISTAVAIEECSGDTESMKETKRDKRTSEPPRRPRPRIRRSVSDVFNCLGPHYFRRAYRMSYESFWKLHEELKEGIEKAHKAHNIRLKARKLKNKFKTMSKDKKNFYSNVLGGRNFKLPPVPNGRIDSSVRLACAIRYFAGGSPYDLAPLYGIAHAEIFFSLWYVVEAINNHPPFFIQYPEDVEKQLKIAKEFEGVSGIPFKNCAGAVDGILIWIEKPTEENAKKAGIGRKKFLCSRKNKFGLNCQAVADKRGRLLDISIKYGGSSSDCLAFEASDLCRRLENGLMHPGLVLFGDNAYINTQYMATPFPNVSSGGKDDYNFYHSQVSYCCLCVCL